MTKRPTLRDKALAMRAFAPLESKRTGLDDGPDLPKKVMEWRDGPRSGYEPPWVAKAASAKPRAKPRREEDLFQIAVCNFLDEHPRIQYWATPNNTYVGAMTGAKMGYLKKQKDMGLKKGALDLNFLFLDKNGERVFGLMELKIKPNKPRPEQLEFKAEAEKRGAKTAVVYGERDQLGKWYMKPVIEALWAWGY